MPPKSKLASINPAALERVKFALDPLSTKLARWVTECNPAGLLAV